MKSVTHGDSGSEQARIVTAIDVLIGVGWLTTPQVDRWHQGRVDYLERLVTANLSKISTAMAAFRQWAQKEGLNPSETAYLSQARDHHPLRFSKSGDARIEAAYRTHWVSPTLPEAKRERLAEEQNRAPDLVVISPLKEWNCEECGSTGDFLFMEGDGPLCLECADLDQLVFLASGDAALTRRAKKASGLAAVVVRFSRSRRRYERQGILVEEEALAQAEAACLADEEVRARRRFRQAEHRSIEDDALKDSLGKEIIRLFPGCPQGRAEDIAAHAGTRGSGRVGRSAAGRTLDPDAVTLAVVAAVRHSETAYDQLLMSGVPRAEARTRVRPDIQAVLDAWRALDSAADRP
ncbi:MAG: DUF2293 domain-containing protein [Acidimicrobiales bacterium]